jgi:anti-sigma factor RsiW
MPLECRDFSSFLPAYVDGEFDGFETVEIETHLAECATCRRDVAMQKGFKAAVRQAAPVIAPIELRHALHDRLRQSEGPDSGRWDALLLRPGRVALAAAAVGAAVWFLAGGTSRMPFAVAHSPIDDAISAHARMLPLDFAASDSMALQRWLETNLRFAVRVPRLPRGSLQGARLSQLHSRTAAMVAYDVPQAPGRRVSLVILDDPDDALPGTEREVANRRVWLSKSRGYNVVSWRSDEIVYSLISDLDEHDVLQLVQTAEMR